VLPKGAEDTVIQEVDGWGKLAKANGYVSLNYVKKI
jgi:hypothetical protein